LLCCPVDSPNQGHESKSRSKAQYKAPEQLSGPCHGKAAAPDTPQEATIIRTLANDVDQV